jgi:hypothetical protein
MKVIRGVCLSDSKVESAKVERLKPPYGTLKQYADFFDLCERLKIEKVDIQFLKSHNISSEGNEYKVVLGLRFLGLIKEDGTVTEKMKSLNAEGEQFQNALNSIVREAYIGLFDGIKDFQKAKSQDIINCLRGDLYSMSPLMAKEGAKIFVFLAQKAGILLSQEIVHDLAVSPERMKSTREEKKGGKSDENKQKKEPKSAKPQHREGTSEGNYILIPENMIKIEHQDKVLMLLPKGDKKARELAVKIAKQFIENYEAEYSGQE